MKLTEGWMNHKGGRFSADMSDIEMHLKDRTTKAVRCPGCRQELHFEKFTERRDSDGDITNWSLKHDCGAELTIFNEGLAKPTFKQFLSEAAGKKPYQVRVESTRPPITGDWKDVMLRADSLEDIAEAVAASPVDEKAHAKFGLSELVSFIHDWVGPGPDGHGSTWDEMEFDVKSLSNDVLKLTWTFSGVNMRQKQGKYGTPVTKSGVLTIMPGSIDEGMEKLGLKLFKPKKKKGTSFVWGGIGYGFAAAPASDGSEGGDGGGGE